MHVHTHTQTHTHTYIHTRLVTLPTPAVSVVMFLKIVALSLASSACCCDVGEGVNCGSQNIVIVWTNTCSTGKTITVIFFFSSFQYLRWCYSQRPCELLTWVLLCLWKLAWESCTSLKWSKKRPWCANNCCLERGSDVRHLNPPRFEFLCWTLYKF